MAAETARGDYGAARKMPLTSTLRGEKLAGALEQQMRSIEKFLQALQLLDNKDMKDFLGK